MPTNPNAATPPSTPARISRSGKCAPRFMSTGRNRSDDHDGGSQQKRRPRSVAHPVHPDNGGNQHDARPDLHHTRHEHHGSEQGGEPQAGNRQCRAAKCRFDQRRHHDPKRDAADGMDDQPHGVLAAVAGKAMAEASGEDCGLLAACEQNGRNDNRQHELYERRTEAAKGRDEESRRLTGIGSETGREVTNSHVGDTGPGLCHRCTDDRDRMQPVRSGWDFESGNSLNHRKNSSGIRDDRADREPERDQHHEQQRKSHYDYGEPAATPQSSLHSQHQRPGRND